MRTASWTGPSWPLSWLVHLPELAVTAGAVVFIVLFIPLLALLCALDEADIGASKGYLEFSAVVSKPLEAGTKYYKLVLSAPKRGGPSAKG